MLALWILESKLNSKGFFFLLLFSLFHFRQIYHNLSKQIFVYSQRKGALAPDAFCFVDPVLLTNQFNCVCKNAVCLTKIYLFKNHLFFQRNCSIKLEALNWISVICILKLLDSQVIHCVSKLFLPQMNGNSQYLLRAPKTKPKFVILIKLLM